LPVLGTVSYVVTAARDTWFARYRPLWFSVSFASLALLFVGTVAIEVAGPGLHSLLGG
jgi:hypothetical protein